MSEPRDIFISYRRRKENLDITGRITDNLEFVFGTRVYRDIDSLLTGENFQNELAAAVSSALAAFAAVHGTGAT